MIKKSATKVKRRQTRLANKIAKGLKEAIAGEVGRSTTIHVKNGKTLGEFGVKMGPEKKLTKTQQLQEEIGTLQFHLDRANNTIARLEDSKSKEILELQDRFDLTVKVTGGPGSGKTTLLRQIMDSVASQSGTEVRLDSAKEELFIKGGIYGPLQRFGIKTKG